MEVQKCWCMFFVSHAHFCNHTLVSASAWKPHPCFVCVFMHKIQPFTGLQRATPIDRLLLQAPEVLPLQNICQLHMGLLLCKARALDLYTTPTFSKHVLVPLNLLELHTALWTTPTDPLLYLLVITGICIATHLQYTDSTNSSACLSFSYRGHIRIKCGSWGQQLWPSFNTDLNVVYRNCYKGSTDHVLLSLIKCIILAALQRAACLHNYYILLSRINLFCYYIVIP